jgi:DNA gyrase subunit A
VLVVMNSGKVVRSAVTGVPAKGRNTMGVIFAKPDKNDRIIAVTLNNEKQLNGVTDENPEGEVAGDVTEGEVPLDSETAAPASAEGTDTTVTATESAAVDPDPDAEIDGGQ